MGKDIDLTRREALKLAGVAASSTLLSACGAQVQPPATPTRRPAVDPILPDMVEVEPGTFMMGSTNGFRNEAPVHQVTLTRPFTMGVFAVTFDEFDRYTDDINKARIRGTIANRGKHPVRGLNWNHAVKYCNWLSEKEGLKPCYTGKSYSTKCDFSANGYRLPTEAEWEFAAMGGVYSQGFMYAGSNDPDEVAWYAGNSEGHPHSIGLKMPNELGLHDMSGNMTEFCWDWFGEEYYAESPSQDPLGPAKAADSMMRNKCLRSTMYRESETYLRNAYRSFDGIEYPANGFRLARTVV